MVGLLGFVHSLSNRNLAMAIVFAMGGLFMSEVQSYNYLAVSSYEEIGKRI